MKNFSLKNSAGSITILVMVLGALVTMIMLAVFSVGRGGSAKSIQNIRFYSTVELIKSNIFAIIDNPHSWTNTINNNQTAGHMGCINNYNGTGVPCSISTYDTSYHSETPPVSAGSKFYGEVIGLYDANNAMFFDSESAVDGFKLDGTRCQNYLSTYVNAGCAIRVRVAWQPFCSANCAVPPAAVVLRVNFFTPSKSPAAGRVPGTLFSSTQTDGILPEMNRFR